MSSFFTNNFKTALNTNQNLMEGMQIKLALFRYAPGLSVPSPTWLAARTVAELTALPGWTEVSSIGGYPLTNSITVATRVLGGSVRNVTNGVTTNGSPNISSATANFQPADVGVYVVGNGIPSGTTIISRTSATAVVLSANATITATNVALAIGTGSRYVMYSQYPFSNLLQSAEVRAIGVVGVSSIGGVSNPLIFVTNTPIGLVTNIAPGDALTSIPDSTFPDNTNRWLFGWGLSTPAPVENEHLVLSRGSPDFEVSGSQHVWMYPQRANMIANPNFEGGGAVGTGQWSSNEALSQVPGTAPNSAPFHGFAGKCTAAVSSAYPNTLVMESNQFSTLMGTSYAEQWTIQAMVMGQGTLRVGLVYWDVDYRVTAADWGDEQWVINDGSWFHVAVQRHAPEASIAMVRLEFQGSSLTIDNVLAERGYLKDWPYFDGDETYGMRDDFSWYGGTNRRGKTYSFWYNHRKTVVSRLFARTVDPNDPTQNVTDEDMEEQGLVYRWVPAGITVVPHLDVFYPFDVQNPLPDKPAGVLPYATPGTPDGVPVPWSKTLSLGTGAYVSTPDAAVFDITGDLCLMARFGVGGSWTGTKTLIAKWASSSTRSYMLQTNNNTLQLQWSVTGSAILTRTSISYTTAPNVFIDGYWVAATLDVDNGASGHDVKFWMSPDGVQWTQVGTTITTAGVTSVFSGTSIVEVGSSVTGTAALFKGTMQDARIYNGIGAHSQPGLGTLVGHFNASVPVASTYTDEFANVWTVKGVTQTGGGLKFSGVTLNYLTTPDAAAFDFTGDFSCVINLIGGASLGHVVGKATSTVAAGLDWLWNVSATTTHQIQWTDNTATARVISFTGVPLLNTHPWWGINFQVSDGTGSTGKIFWSDNGTTWTLAATATPLVYSPQNIRVGTQPVQSMGRAAGASAMTGELRALRIYNGIGANTAPGQGTLVANVPLTGNWTAGPQTDAQGNVWTLVGGPWSYVQAP